MRSSARRGAVVAAVTVALVGVTSAGAVPPDPDEGSPTFEYTDPGSREVAGAEDDQAAAAGPAEEQVSDTGLWIVQLDEPSVARYEAMPRTTGSMSVEQYADTVAEKQEALTADLSETLDRTVTAEFEYQNVLNAVAVPLGEDEVGQVRALPGVAAVYPDVVRELQTDVSNDLIGSPAAWAGDNSAGLSTKGEGVLVAMIDSGVNPEHPSFAAESEDGYVHENPLGSGTFLGACDPDDDTYYNPDFPCTDKLIGAYSMNPIGPDAYDDDGHGSHVGSTIAGNTHTATVEMGASSIERQIQGVAPRANVISYKVCAPGCPGSASVAAIDQAVADGVQVINYSISGGDNPWADPVELAFLDARAAGVVVAAAAGNDGPTASTVAHTGPWNLSVAASTHQRIFAHAVSVTDPEAPEGLLDMPAFPGDGPQLTETLTAPLLDAAAISPGNDVGCGPFPGGSLDGSIVLIKRGVCNFDQKVLNAQSGGAVAVLMDNDTAGPPTSPGGLLDTEIPTMMVTDLLGADLRAYLADNPEAEITIAPEVEVVEDDTWIDVMAGFSSRGPTPFDGLAPTLTAPGVNILAASVAVDDDPVQYALMNGTSMASPHAAGAAALLTEIYPDLSPTEIRSIMSMTADYDELIKEDGDTPADAWTQGSGRLDIEASGRAGLAMDETPENFTAANPEAGGDPATLNTPSAVEQECQATCTFTRTVTSIAQVPATYTAEASAPEITVSPAEFTLEPGAEQEITVTVDVSATPIGEWLEGRVGLSTDAEHAGGLPVADSTIPVVVLTDEVPVDPPALTLDPESLETSQLPDEQFLHTVNLGNAGDFDLEWSFGPVIADQRPTGIHSPSSYSTVQDAGIISADDFILSEEETIDTIQAAGDWPFGKDVQDEASEITWVIHADDGGRPGEEVWSYTTTPDAAGVSYFDDDITLVLSKAGEEPVTLAADTYWLSVYPSIPYDVRFADRWNWTGADQAGSVPYLIDEADLFGNGFTDWTSYSDIGMANQSLAFRLEGVRSEACTLPDWLLISPMAGVTERDGLTELDVITDSTGMAPGEYTTNVCVESNDPEQETLEFPVTLTVERPPSPDIAVTPESIAVEQGADETTESTLTIANPGERELEFEIAEREGEGEGAESAGTRAASDFEQGFDTMGDAISDGWAVRNTSQPVGIHSWGPGNANVMPAHEGALPNSFTASNFQATGNTGVISNWLITPEVDLVDGSTFSFWTRTYEDAYRPERLEVRISSAGTSLNVGTGYDSVGDFTDRVLVINEELTATGYPQEWTQYSVTIEGYDEGATGRLALRTHIPDAGINGPNSDYIGIDTAVFDGTFVPDPESCVGAGDVPWLSVDTLAGSVAAGESLDVTVGLDSTGLADGTYDADLCIASNAYGTPETSVPVTLTVGEDTPPAAVVERIEGAERYATAAEISDQFPDGVSTVYIANAEDYADGADALAGGAAAATGAVEFVPNVTAEGEPAPILLVKRGAIPSATQDALDALAPKSAVLLGGRTVIADGVERALEADGITVERVSGTDRYETAAALAGHYDAGLDTVYVATGQSAAEGDGVALADALTAASLAGGQGSPVLLTRPNHLPAATAAALAELDPAAIVLVGGEAAVHPDVEAALDAIAPTTRSGGEDRYETAVALTADYAADGDVLYVASGLNFPDALAGSALTGSQAAPLLVLNEGVPESIEEEILRLSPQGITILGGTGSIDAVTEAALQDLLDVTSTD